MLSQNQALDDKQKLQVKLTTALKYAKITCALGASNKYDDYLKSGGWSTLQIYFKLYKGFYRKPSHCTEKDKDLDIVDIDLNPKVVYNMQKDIKAASSENHWFYSLIDVKNPNSTPKLQAMISPGPQTLPWCSPVTDPQFQLSQPILEVFWRASISSVTRHGTCIDYASLIFMYLWQYSEGIHRIEIMRQPGFDHVYVVINREGTPEDSTSWGDAWVIDGWYKEGIIYHAREYRDKIEEIKTIINKDIDNLSACIGVDTNENPKIHEINPVIVEVVPTRDPYPTYDCKNSVFDYYVFLDGRLLCPQAPFTETQQGIAPYQHMKSLIEFNNERVAHTNKMQPILEEVRLFHLSRNSDMESDDVTMTKNKSSATQGQLM